MNKNVDDSSFVWKAKEFDTDDVFFNNISKLTIKSKYIIESNMLFQIKKHNNEFNKPKYYVLDILFAIY